MDFTKGFNKENLKQTRSYLEQKFEEILKETGVHFQIGNISFQDEEFSTTLKGKLNITPQENKDKEEWDMYSTMFGFQRDDFGKEFTTRDGKTYVVCGIKKYAETKPLVAHLKGDPNKKFIFHKDIRKVLHPEIKF